MLIPFWFIFSVLFGVSLPRQTFLKINDNFQRPKKNISKYCDVAPLTDLNETTGSVISTQKLCVFRQNGLHVQLVRGY